MAPSTQTIGPLERIRAAVPLMPVGAFLVEGADERTARVTAWSDELLAIVGKAPSESLAEWAASLLREEDRGAADRAARQVFGERQPLRSQTFWMRQESGLRAVRVDATPVLEEGRLVGVLVAVRDETDARRAEQHVKASEARLALALDSARQGSWEIDLETERVEASPRLYEIFGAVDRSDLCTRADWRAFVLDEDKSLIQGAIDEAAATDGAYSVEYRIRRKSDGAVRWIASQGQLHVEPDGRRTLVGVAADVTERRESAELLRASEERLRLFVEHTPAAVAMLDRELRYLVVSRRWLTDYKLHRDDVLGRSHYEVFPEIPERWRLIHRRALAGAVEAAEQEPFVRADGTVDWVRWEVRPWRDRAGEIGGIVIFSEVVTARRQAEEALKQSEERYRFLVEMSPDAILLHDLDIVLFANRAAARLFGAANGHELVGRKYMSLVQPAFRDAVRRRAERIRKTGSATPPGELGMLRLDGAPLEVEAAASPAVHGGRAVFQVVIRDVSGRRRAEEAQALLAAIVTGSEDAIVSMDLEGKVLTWNAAAQRLLGYAASEIVGHSIDLIVPPDRRDEERRILDRVERGELIDQLETVRVAKAGRLIDVAVTVSPLRNAQGRIVGASKIARDISARKRMTEELERSRDALREDDRRKTEFLAVLSHELRNPLAPIRNSLYVLDRSAPESPQAVRAKAVIDRQVQQLTHLVDDLLDVTRITRNKIHLQLERADANEVVRRAAEDLRYLFEQRGITLEIEPAPRTPFVEVDVPRLMQIVGNLLHNAAKFTGPGGSARVWLEVDAEAGRVSIHVTDTGVGMARETLEHLFEPFMQADRTLDRSRGGLGLGLALVKGLVGLHGGEIAARSEGLGRGSDFEVRLPLAAQPAAGAEPTPRPEAPSRRVLVIEDNVDSAESLREVLEMAGHQVSLAHTGPDGVEEALRSRPELILCDIGLPGMDGYAVARVLRADPRTRDVLLVALSGYAQPEDLQRAVEAGFDRHLPKPPDLERLQELIAGGRRASPGA